MKFFTIFPVLAFFWSLVAAVPAVMPRPLPMSLGDIVKCTFCAKLPSLVQPVCYTHCGELMTRGVNNNTMVGNTTSTTSLARAVLPLADDISKKPLPPVGRAVLPLANDTSRQPSLPASYEDLPKDATSICDFCDKFSGELGTECHTTCKFSNAHIFTPWVPNVMWDFCADGCTAHGCTGPYYGTCFTVCTKCYADDYHSDVRPAWYGRPQPNACFCPRVEFSDQYDNELTHPTDDPYVTLNQHHFACSESGKVCLAQM
ncbi:hypothetical protein C7974DRAFT_375556 [Boeremia exigua]|uniref:uncharacterized protein n=1 Tax=Boeremia exigua TaxID=749465 RepID=UPI001E8CC3CF|nr:uncharacterized protein C7974DRAFT_375556 [Boeremia exigua]KAH6633478.1 hypothetical protein C7974DRAFT_375556 [Boeremia exigua]